jgi:hypothetical protein
LKPPHRTRPADFCTRFFILLLLQHGAAPCFSLLSGARIKRSADYMFSYRSMSHQSDFLGVSCTTLENEKGSWLRLVQPQLNMLDGRFDECGNGMKSCIPSFPQARRLICRVTCAKFRHKLVQMESSLTSRGPLCRIIHVTTTESSQKGALFSSMRPQSKKTDTIWTLHQSLELCLRHRTHLDRSYYSPQSCGFCPAVVMSVLKDPGPRSWMHILEYACTATSSPSTR